MSDIKIVFLKFKKEILVEELEEIKTEIRFLTVKELQETFKIGRRQAYALVNLDGFPSIKIGTKIIIPEAELKKWIKTQCGKTIYI